MSIASKQTLLRDIEKSLGSVVTVDTLTTIMKILSEHLSVYDVEQTGDQFNDVETEELLGVYLDAKRIEGRSDKTIERYRYIIQRVFDAVNVPVRKISVFHLRKYFSDEKARGISDRTMDGTRQVLSAFFGWLLKEGLLENDPTVNLGSIKSIKKVRKPFSQSEIERMKEACENDRDKAIIATLMSTGCRISEMTQLNRNDVDLDHLECKVLGKGNKERVVYLDPVAGMMIRTYLSEREDSSDALFVGRRGERLQPGGVRAMLVRLADAANVEHVHPHKFRRTLATNLIRRGMPIQEVACILGHDKLDTTMGYVVLDKSEVKNAYRKYAS